jgi:predicted transcriptional regulator
MADIPCIYEVALINEEDKLKKDIVNGKALDILLILLSGSRTIREISRELNIPSFSTQLYIKRLIGANFIKVMDVKVADGKVEKTYELASTDIEILNYLKNNCTSNDGKENIELSAQHFSSLTRDVIRNIGDYKQKPHKIKAYFIKAEEETMKNFKKDLDALFEKYQSLENLEATETYSFISVLAPYKLG